MKTEIQHGIYFENGRKFYCGGIPVVEVQGSWFQMGRQYGALLRGELEKIHAFAKQAPDGMARVGQLGRGSISGLKRYDELFRGMAETSGFSLEQLRIISSVEVIYLDCITSDLRQTFNGGCCSSLAVWGDYTRTGEVLFGRNFDWLPEFESILDTLALCVFHPSDGANSVAFLNWAGCPYMTTGMNERGLFLELNSGAFADADIVAERIHNVWLLWEFLLNSDDAAALRRAFATCRASAAYIIGTADADKAEGFEWHTGGEYLSAQQEDGLMAAANHFTAPEWQNSPGAALCGESSSFRRRENLLTLAKKYHDANEKIGPEEMMAVFEKTTADGGAKVCGTLFQVIAVPAEQKWYVKTKNMDDWAEIPLMNILKGNGELI